ncbi:MAG: T9SS type A sorting domain-containing protein [Bacteroidota bacterium]
MLKKLLLLIVLLGNVVVVKASTKNFAAFVNAEQMAMDTTLTCEAVGISLDFNICITDEFGATEKVNICEALARETPPVTIDLCEPLDFDDLVGFDRLYNGAVFGLLDSLGCDLFPFQVPVCTTDSEGNQRVFFSFCEAFDEGLSLEELSVCDEALFDPPTDVVDPIGCPDFGFDFELDVCFVDDTVGIATFPLCDALLIGLPLNEFEICRAALDSLDCDPEGVDFPICVLDETGERIQFPSPCAAFQAGYILTDFTSCRPPSDAPQNQLTCEALGLYFDFTVCRTKEDGSTETLLFCDALETEPNLDNLSICQETLASLTVDNCDIFGLDLAVCWTNEDGATRTFPNPCSALQAGVSADELDFCEGAVQSAMSRLLVTSIEETTSDLVETVTLYPNPVEDQFFVEFAVSKSTLYEVTIMGLNGQVMQRQTGEAIAGQNIVTLDVTTLPAGMYLANLQTNTQRASRKLMKQ